METYVITWKIGYRISSKIWHRINMTIYAFKLALWGKLYLNNYKRHQILEAICIQQLLAIKMIKLFIWLCTVKQVTTLWTCKSQSETSKDLTYKISILQSSCESESCHLKCPFMDCNSLCRHVCVRMCGLCQWPHLQTSSWYTLLSIEVS